MSSTLLIVIAVVVVLAGLGILLLRTPLVPARARPSSGPAPVARGEGLGAKVRALLGGGADEDAWRQLEDLLLRADVGPRGASDLVARIRARFTPGADAAASCADEMVAVLGPDEDLHLAVGPPGRRAGRRRQRIGQDDDDRQAGLAPRRARAAA